MIASLFIFAYSFWYKLKSNHHMYWLGCSWFLWIYSVVMLPSLWIIWVHMNNKWAINTVSYFASQEYRHEHESFVNSVNIFILNWSTYLDMKILFLIILNLFFKYIACSFCLDNYCLGIFDDDDIIFQLKAINYHLSGDGNYIWYDSEIEWWL